jgi:hypothetical protein
MHYFSGKQLFRRKKDFKNQRLVLSFINFHSGPDLFIWHLDIGQFHSVQGAGKGLDVGRPDGADVARDPMDPCLFRKDHEAGHGAGRLLMEAEEQVVRTHLVLADQAEAALLARDDLLSHHQSA